MWTYIDLTLVLHRQRVSSFKTAVQKNCYCTVSPADLLYKATERAGVVAHNETCACHSMPSRCVDISFPFVMTKSNSCTSKAPANMSTRQRTKQKSMPRWLYRRFFPSAEPEHTMEYEILLPQEEEDSKEKHTASGDRDKLSKEP